MKDKVYVCRRCEFRLAKAPDFEGVAFSWTDETFKKLKLKFMQVFGRKPNNKVVLTSCLGHCPQDAIAFERTQKGVLQEFETYAPSLDEEAVFDLVFKEGEEQI